MRALIVDNDEAMRSLFIRLMRRLNWEIVAATNGSEALDLFEAGKFQTIILDVDLGGGPDGIDVAEHIHSQEPDVPIIIVSGDALNGERVAKAKVGAFLPKPFNISNLETLLPRTR